LDQLDAFIGTPTFFLWWLGSSPMSLSNSLHSCIRLRSLESSMTPQSSSQWI
jgi:hypothetical protein